MVKDYVIRGSVLILFFLSVHKGGAGILMDLGQWESAFIWDSRNPQLLYDYGRNALEEWRVTGNSEKLGEANQRLEDLTELLPDSGQGWLTLALARKEVHLRSVDAINIRYWEALWQAMDAASAT